MAEAVNVRCTILARCIVYVAVVGKPNEAESGDASAYLVRRHFCTW